MTTTYKIIRNLALEAHKGQVDKAGDPYERHLKAVALLAAYVNPFDLDNEDVYLTGFLHDIIEDTEHDATSLKAAGVPEPVIEAVKFLTKHDGDNYTAYMARLIAGNNKLAMTVKLGDLYDHLNNGNEIPTKKVKKYADALIQLNVAVVALIKKGDA